MCAVSPGANAQHLSLGSMEMKSDKFDMHQLKAYYGACASRVRLCVTCAVTSVPPVPPIIAHA